MSCGHEHHSHGGHGDHSHSHSHDDDSHIHPDESPSNLLFSCISLPHVTSLNTTSSTSAKNIIKPWHLRNSGSQGAEVEDESLFVESDADDQMIIRVPFEGTCKLKSILLKTGPGDDLTPSSVVLFVNQDPPLDFSSSIEERVSLPSHSPRKDAPAQKLESIAESREAVEYPLRVTRFTNVRDVTLLVPGSNGGVKTRIYYLGFKGDSNMVARDAPVGLVYEATPQLKDHAKIRGTEMGQSRLGQ